MKKIFIIMTLLAMQIFSGCGDSQSKTETPKSEEPKFDLSNAKDGTYTAESSLDEKLGKSVLTLTIKDKKITAANFSGYDLFGNEKDENYGSLTGKDSADYKKAQVAVKAIKTYPQQLIETQDLNKVDAISGASISYSQFIETATMISKEISK